MKLKEGRVTTREKVQNMIREIERFNASGKYYRPLFVEAIVEARAAVNAGRSEDVWEQVLGAVRTVRQLAADLASL